LTDVDVVVEPQSLSRLVGYLQDPNVGGASGVEVPIGDQSLMSRVEAGYKSIYAATRMSEASVDTPLMCESEFSVFNRKAITPLKQGCMCDDLELTVNLRSHGGKAVYVSDAPFFEREAAVLRPKLFHKYRRGMANQHGLLRSWRVLFNKRFGKYGSIVFPYEFFVHIISPILLLLAIALFVASVIASPSAVTVETTIAVVSGLVPLILLRQLTHKYKSNEILNVRGRLTWLLGAVAFLAFQLVLVASLAHLALRGPKLQWTQIAETRSPTRPELQTVQTG
jgi:cellulose synthase/poly-beta-1,6-N-acetylglucosamine synthase-like glycosyltransferase